MSDPSWPPCPACGGEGSTILHEATPDAPASHATIKCDACGRVYRGVLRSSKPVSVACIISEGETSRTKRIEVPSTDKLRVDGEVYGDEHRLLITALELNDGRRVRTAPPEKVKTIWCKVFDTVDVPVAINRREYTVPFALKVPPEEEFFVGDQVTVRGLPVVIHSIKTTDGTKTRGSALARDIVRLYAKDPKPLGGGEGGGAREGARGPGARAGRTRGS